MGSVALTPGASGGVFEVRVDGDLVWSRKAKGRFPDIKELKQLVRDRIAPGRSLGHSDKSLSRARRKAPAAKGGRRAFDAYGLGAAGSLTETIPPPLT